MDIQFNNVLKNSENIDIPKLKKSLAITDIKKNIVDNGYWVKKYLCSCHSFFNHVRKSCELNHVEGGRNLFNDNENRHLAGSRFPQSREDMRLPQSLSDR